MFKTCLTFFFMICVGATVSAQKKYTISGTIADNKSGETLIGAAITVEEIPGVGAVTNEYGFYSLSLPAGNYRFKVNYLGYQTITLDTNLSQDIRKDFNIVSNSTQLDSVVIVDTETGVTSTIIGQEKIDMEVMNKVPVLFGERDVFKTIQLLPGVQPASEGSSGFYVRGGTADQNLILLDEATVYNPSHLLGFFSTFNSDAIKGATLYKGNAPAHFGGRISSVMDVRMNEGDNQQYHVSGGIGLISARLNVEGPIQKGKSSFLFTGRRTYLDLFVKAFARRDTTLEGVVLNFFDLNGKLNFKLGKKSRLFISGYFGQDELGLAGFTNRWHNGTATVRWNYVINSKLFSNTSFIFSDYRNTIDINSEELPNVKIRSEIMDFNLKQEFQIYPSPKHSIRTGLNSTYHVITPGEIDISGGTVFDVSDLTNRYSWENAIYAEDDWSVAPWLKMNYGVRLVNFNAMGDGDFYNFDADGNVTDTMRYGVGEIAHSYFNIEPRLSFNFRLAEFTSLKTGYARHTQFLHLLSNSTTNNPTDKWIPSSNNVRPQISDQVSLGIFQNFKQNMFEVSVEGYFKNLQNQLDYKDGADITNNELYEADLLYGEGRAYGMEIAVRKKKGAFTGWIAYTLSRSEKKIDGINSSNWYPARQDRTHDLSVVLIYEYKRWTFSSTFVYYTGNAVTFPSGKYEVEGKTVWLYTDRNAYRMPDYHRLDIGITVDLRKKNYKVKYNKKGQPRRRMMVSELGFGAYNVYNQMNTYTITFRNSKEDPNKTEAVSTALFGIVPYVSWNFKF